jgi:hypothetical protein
MTAETIIHLSGIDSINWAINFDKELINMGYSVAPNGDEYRDHDFCSYFDLNELIMISRNVALASYLKLKLSEFIVRINTGDTHGSI